MGPSILPEPSTPFGNRVRRRLADEIVIWFTSVGRDGTPQPNPVWFLWEEPTFLVYNRPQAHRLMHIRRRPQVALHFDGNGRGGDIVVFTGKAEILDGYPLAHENTAYLAKYRQHMLRVSGSLEGFGTDYPVAVRVQVTRVRGF